MRSRKASTGPIDGQPFDPGECGAILINAVAWVFSRAVGLRDPNLEQVIEAAVKSEKLPGMKSVRRDAHEATETCILHAPGGCLSSAKAVA